MPQQHPPRSHAIHARVRSYSRAGGRLTDAQARALERHGAYYVVDVPRADAIRTVDASYRLDPVAVFGHAGQLRPLIVEVGSGAGEAILAHAAAHPGVDHLAVEAWETAIARIVRDAAKAGLRNVRVVPADAAQLLATALPVGCASEVWVFFPDPWRKPRHRKRRLVTVAFADSVARVLRPGGVWRLATDWADYAWQMRDVLEEVSALPEGLQADSTGPYFRYDDAGARADLGEATAEENSLGNGPDPGSPAGMRGGWSQRYAGRVMTRFEQRGIDAGRTIRDLTAVRTSEMWVPPRAEPVAL
ncbi:tRNA (guanosine(46)-N7)-methyltransferase TrmB [Actinomyces sp. MRS3W]|uniref:tRNA (guanosine(46)-N7)-methyltransferase TrmB n=1 Tax=Actinomyces sp. MRS3W TaxID=2800796 RepID=UPI0028FD8B75|nr:tRNA (guanosine(46)-N7)-methyltransferase TrmB [Actinomyces sp. MRS3W]MDU0349067.1 tRNA (guanosine(46)-N7)-methyltransferase TrmB [Actinomyces sp. MRS3W]